MSKKLIILIVIVATATIAYAASKVSDLTAVTSADDADLLMLVDTSASASRKITVSNFLSGVDPAGTDNSTDVTLNASATTGGLSLNAQEISHRAATNAQTGYATDTHITAIEANTAKTSLENDSVTMDKIDDDGNFTALTGNWYTTGELNGKLDVNLDITATYAVPTQAHYGGVAVNNDADAIEMDLNAAAVGMSLLVVSNAAGVITLDPNGTDTFVYEGTEAAAGEALVSAGAQGDSLSIICVEANQWLVIGHDATGWTEETP